MIIIEESELELYISDELKRIAKNLGYTYIDNSSNKNIGGSGKIKVGSVTIYINYTNIVNSIKTVLDVKRINCDCTNDIDSLTDISVDCQTASMIIKSIQESNLMSINDITR